jgi:hypothetical protein
MTKAFARPPATFVVAAFPFLIVFGTACPGSLDMTGAGGTMGTGGTGGACVPSGAAPCDAFAMFSGQRCSALGCHGAGLPNGIDMQSPGLSARLLGKMSTSATCAPSGKPYLVPNSNPATGLLIDKLHPSPPCGSIMPFADIGGVLTSEEMACIMDWSTAVTSRCWTQ